MFSAFHSPAAWLSLRGRLVGETNPETPELLQDFRALRTEMQAVGMFQSSKLYYAYKVRCSALLQEHFGEKAYLLLLPEREQRGDRHPVSGHTAL